MAALRSTILNVVFVAATLVAAYALLGAAPSPGSERHATAIPKIAPDKILILKGQRRLHLLRRGRILKTYRIALGFNPKGHKRREGDGRTPEGHYFISARNPNSRFHKSLKISYPNARDRARARAAGLSPGGDIFIHGLPGGAASIGKLHALRDWTLGCVAVTNAQIEEIWATVPDGTPVEIRP